MTRADALLIALLAGLIGLSYAALWQPAAPAQWLEVRSVGAAPERHRLDQTRRVDIPGRQGISQLALEPGRARFVAGPCRNQVCVHAGWLSRAGEAAACLPNGVSIRLVGREPELDAMSY